MNAERRGSVRRCGAHLIVAAVLGVVLALPADASSVVPMSVPTLADHAGQVIVGDVASTRSYWAQDPRRIETEIAFEDVEYLKGRLAHSGSTFRLIVPGGTVGRTSERLAGAPTFAAGERWLLFLLPQYKTHPVVGIWQGAFRIESDAEGIERVYDAGGRPIAGLSAAGFARVVRPGGGSAGEHLVGTHNAWLRPAAARGGQAEPMAYEDFVRLIEPMLLGSKDYELAEPAGRRVLVQYHSVPLRPSPGQADARRSGQALRQAGALPREGAAQHRGADEP